MGDLKSVWDNPPLADHDLSGDSLVSSGSDPNSQDGGGPAALQPVWPSDKYVAKVTDTIETANSSGLPPLPNRFAPSGTPPAPPTLQDRTPGTIDQQ
jgi:hypothetical protein